MKAGYGFFANDKVRYAKVSAPRIAQTKQRIAQQPVALLVQDTTEIDLTRPDQEVAAAGELDGARRGFLLHAMQAFTPEACRWSPRGPKCPTEPKAPRMPQQHRNSRSVNRRRSKIRRACAG